MIDTVVLLLDRDDFIISKPDRFNTNANIFMNYDSDRFPKNGFNKSVNNPTKSDISKYGHLPRLTLLARNNRVGSSIQLRIEFSAPKIVYGNNFEEFETENFYELIAKLMEKLKIMGVITTEDKLIDSKVSTIHYSKNILLDPYTKCSYILNELRKVNLNQKLDLSTTDYRNFGHAVKYHSNSFEIVFYDKIKDLDRSRISEKRSIENDNWLQLDLFNKMSYYNKINVLRIEIRLNGRRTINNNLKKINMHIEPTLQNLFSSRISKGILIRYFDLITTNWHSDTSQQITPEDLFIEIKRSTQYKPTKILTLIGAMEVADSIGFLGLRSLLSPMNDRTFQRIKSEIMDLELNNTMSYKMMQEVCNKLNEFKCIKKIDLVPEN